MSNACPDCGLPRGSDAVDDSGHRTMPDGYCWREEGCYETISEHRCYRLAYERVKAELERAQNRGVIVTLKTKDGKTREVLRLTREGYGPHGESVAESFTVHEDETPCSILVARDPLFSNDPPKEKV